MDKLPEIYTLDPELVNQMIADFMQWCKDHNELDAENGFYIEAKSGMILRGLPVPKGYN